MVLLIGCSGIIYGGLFANRMGVILHVYFKPFIISPKCFKTKAVVMVSVYIWSPDEAQKLSCFLCRFFSSYWPLC